MNPYRFLNSADIARHCQKIQHRFSPLGTAYLVWKSKKHTISEKHQAYWEIIGTSPNVVISHNLRGNPGYHPKLHDFLKQYMELENQLLAAFYAEAPNTVYTYHHYSCAQESAVKSPLYSSLDDCIHAAKGHAGNMTDAWISIYKQKLSGRGYKDGQVIIADMTPDYSGIAQLWQEGDGLFTNVEMDILYTFAYFWFQIPTPFQRGDIVWDTESKIPFVLDFVCYQEADPCSIARWEREGDETDMTASGYFIEESGQVFHNVRDNYLSLEYYPKKPEGAKRILKALSSYLKKEIDLALLLNIYTMILQEEKRIQPEKPHPDK